jgi:hypothetical protein
MNPVLFSQRDGRWANQVLGESQTTIGSHGCATTCVGMKYGITPDTINNRLKAFGGYAAPQSDPYQKNLLIWKKLEEAFPGIIFGQRYYTYNNELVKQNLPCLVEVNGAPIGGSLHWVLYIGDHKLFDPWDGKEKPTSTYQPLSFVALSGAYAQQVNSSENYYKGIDMTNKESVKVAIDAWHQLTSKASLAGSDLEAIQRELNEARVQVQVANDALKNYSEMKILGFTTPDDIRKAIQDKDNTNLALQTEIAEVRDSNSKLASLVAQANREDHTVAELGKKALAQNEELHQTIVDIAKAVGADKVDKRNILSKIFNIRDLSEHFLKKQENEQKIKAAEVRQERIVAQKQSNWLAELLGGGERT